MTWLAPAAELSPAQRRLLDQGLTGHLVLEGPAGSGKTALLLHRAAALRDRFRVDPGRLRIFTYTQVLKSFVGASLDLLELPGDTLSTFDAWCVAQHRRLIGGRLPMASGHTAFEQVQYDLEQHLARRTGWLLDAALVDEGQDLQPRAFRILARAARHVTVVMDPYQRIFAGGCTPAQVRVALGLGEHDPGLRLDLGYRCGREVVTFAAGFLDDPGERSRFVRQAQEARSAGQKPLACFGDDTDARLTGLVRQRLALGERLGILLPRTHQVHSLAERLREAGIPVELALPSQGPGDAAPHFENSLPKLCTYHSAKGLSFDSVFLPRLENASFPRDAGPARRRLLFVGLTRAARWVFLGRDPRQPFDEDPWLAEAERAGFLVVQRDEEPRGSATAGEAGSASFF